MYLTHIDADGNDSPPILVDNSTAANRAVNISGVRERRAGWLAANWRPGHRLLQAVQ